MLGKVPSFVKKKSTSLVGGVYEDDDAFLSSMNPIGKNIGTGKNTLNSFISSAGIVSTDTCVSGTEKITCSGTSTSTGIQDDEESSSSEGRTVCNSTNSFGPHHFTFKWEDKKHTKFCTVIISVTSGLFNDGKLEGKILPTVSSDGKILNFKCAWAESMTSKKLLIDAMKAFVGSKVTEIQMTQAFEKEITRARKRFKLNTYQSLGGIAAIDLPYRVESDIKFVKPMICSLSNACVLYVVLKKKVSESDGAKFNLNCLNSTAQYDSDSTEDDDFCGCN
jgi:hypothetical protein